MTSMIFWVQCPECEGRFYCHAEDLRHTEWELLCPYCHNMFKQEESLAIWDYASGGRAAWESSTSMRAQRETSNPSDMYESYETERSGS